MNGPTSLRSAAALPHKRAVPDRAVGAVEWEGTMGAKSLASIGWKSVRVRIAMADGAWAFVEELARLNVVPVRDFIPILLGRGIESWQTGQGPKPWDVVPVDWHGPVPGPDGQIYAQTSLDDLGLTQDVEG